jgi:hypothetical protein
MDSYQVRLRPKLTCLDEASTLAEGLPSWPDPWDPATNHQRSDLSAHESLPQREEEDGAFDVSVEEWMEVQLLECQNLARQNGYAELANLLDAALDLLARDVTGSSRAPDAFALDIVLSFPAQRGS